MIKKIELLKKAILKSYSNYINYGPRSTQKLVPIHSYFATILGEIFQGDFTVHYIDSHIKEMKVSGKYYDKDIDITITHKNLPVLCLGIKFVTSNYKQNSNNYFENMMGETANIQAIGDLPYFQAIILRYQTPYYSRTLQKSGIKKPNKIEKINEHDLMKYIKLAYDSPQAHKPYAIGIILVDLVENYRKVKILNPNEIFNSDFANLFMKKLSFEHLFNEIENYKNYLLKKSNGI